MIGGAWEEIARLAESLLAGRKQRTCPFAGAIVEPHGDIRPSIVFYRPDVEQATDAVDFDWMGQRSWGGSMPVHAH